MFYYHLKFELYVPIQENYNKIDNINSVNKQLQSKKPKRHIIKQSELYYVPTDLFASLPVHSKSYNSNNNNSSSREEAFNSKNKEKSRESASFSKPRTPVVAEKLPAIPPTPVPDLNKGDLSKSRASEWKSIGKWGTTAVLSSVPANNSPETKSLDKTKDFRFGAIFLEWFTEKSLKMSEEQEHPTKTIPQNSTGQSSDSLPPSNSTAHPTSSTLAEINGQNPKNVTSSITRPVAQFLPIEPNRTNLGYGILHLYRDPKEIPQSNETNSSSQETIGINGKQVSNSGASGNESFNLELNGQNLDLSDKTILAVLAVPVSFSASDFLGFVAPVRKFVSHFRMIRDSALNKYMVLMKFRTARSANDFYNNYNGRAFTSMEPEICHVVYIKSIEFKPTSTPANEFSFQHDPFLSSLQQTDTNSMLHELPTCPVCLERMDSNATGLLTIQCQHTFHCKCLSKWGDSSCPVCRYSQKRETLEFSQNECGVCGSTESLWMCILCGNVGCGRYQGAHAYYHYKETPTHLYAIELETQRVWDYAGDGYVHRLIQNKSDGKLVELPSPNAPALMQSQSVVNQDKVDQIELEYSHLLTTQLSSQRTFYEEKHSTFTLQLSSLSSQVQKLTDEVANLKLDNEKLKNEKELLETQQIPNLLKEKIAIEKKLVKSRERIDKVEKEWKEEKEMGRSLAANQQHLQEQLAAKDTIIQDLEEQVKDLMFSLAYQDKMKENPELAGGQIVVAENSNTAVTGGQDEKMGEVSVSSVLGPVWFLFDVFVGAIQLLKPIFSITLAIFIAWSSLNFVSHTFQNDVTLFVCRFPFSSIVPLCQSPIPDFSRLVTRQVETYEQIMDQTMSQSGLTSSLALDIKKAELATGDLRTLVKYSSLTCAPELVDRLNEFVDKSRVVGRNLQVLQARTRSSVDNLITYNLFALKALENVRDHKVSSKELAQAYDQMMGLMEGDLKRMILVGQEILGSLTDLDAMLAGIHELTAQEASLQKFERHKLLAELWSYLGGNRVRRHIFQENLQLLQDLDKQRRHAVAQIQTTLYSLTSFQLDLEELREQVLKPSLINMPIEVHIENVGKGIERLKSSKVAIKSMDNEPAKQKSIDT
ncbi:5633_t:CDS:2 [Ambispora gerdemannii]|uniref:5633_t:CDS:1 n=1 Tax=Ambispora gerdemannii TaxID=144530 RepID=A0A9N9DD18_9GLOM|nr:5633_t:CDS:2 [Ambispora gerdemannii]